MGKPDLTIDQELAALKEENLFLRLEKELAALKEENLRLRLHPLQRKLTALLIRFDDQDVGEIKRGLRGLDEELRALTGQGTAASRRRRWRLTSRDGSMKEREKRRETIEGTGVEPWLKPRPEEDGPPEDLRKSWRKEDVLLRHDPVILDVFGQSGGRLPNLEEIEDDQASELP